MEANLERLLNAVTSALCEPLDTHVTIEMRHDVFRKVCNKKDLPLNTKIWLEKSDFSDTHFPSGWSDAFVNKRGDQRTVIFPIAVRLFLARSRKLYCIDGQELPRRWIEKLSISCIKQTHWTNSWIAMLFICCVYSQTTCGSSSILLYFLTVCLATRLFSCSQ